MTAVSAQLGTPFMPWQRDLVDVALEIDPATGLLVYRTVIATVPRQSGKTKLELGVAVHRCITWPGQVVTYTAQTRVKARQKWEDDHLATLDASPFGPSIDQGGRFYRVRKTTGMEAVLWANGSRYGIEAVTKQSGHGDTLDLGFIDEAFAQVDGRTEQAMKPAMITRSQPQLWIVSTAGDEASKFLRDKVDAGRERCEAGATSGICHLEYSAPDDADPEDPATWWACMPALGHTVTEDAVRADFQSMPLREFRRAYLNQWVDAIPDEWLVIPQAAWESLRADPVAHGQVALAVDVSPDERTGSIVAAWRRPDGNMDVEIVERRPQTAWIPDRITELVRGHRPVATVIDGAAGTAGGVDGGRTRGTRGRGNAAEHPRGRGGVRGVLRHGDGLAVAAALGRPGAGQGCRFRR